MKSTDPVPAPQGLKFVRTRKSNPLSAPSTANPLRATAFLALVGLVVGCLYFTSSASSANNVFIEKTSHLAGAGASSGTLTTPGEASLKNLESTMFAPWSPLEPMPQSPVAVTIYESDCSTPKTLFNVQDVDKTVCAKVTGAPPGLRLIWSNARFVSMQIDPISSSNQDFSFTLTTASSLGDWRVIAYEPFGGSVYQVTNFTVIDADNPVVDLTVNTGVTKSPVSVGGQVLFEIQVTNNGPSTATNVTLTDAVPADTTFVSFAQLEGPVFSCTSPMAGSTSGSSVCAITSLGKGEQATFLATFEVAGGTAAGTEISNTADVASATNDSKVENNFSTGLATVAATPCTLTCPENITVSAVSGEAGAVVTYEAASSTGNCGDISSHPTSGSFFPVGTTTVIVAGETGDACSFQVTVENPGGLAISLSGANPLALECGVNFNDPGATAVNGVGNPVPITVSGTVDSHTPGTYSLTYTATEGQNSVSTSRTVNVSDSEAPVITLEGPNPMTVSFGQPFVDPGASANDACEGAKPVNSSGTVDTNTPGTYTVTYTASDSQNRIATATRSVIVENDGTAPPTITLNGNNQITIECGTNFTDPGATANVSGVGPVPVTTSGAVDSQTPGTYTITYTACVEDSPGNCDPNRTSQAERTVTVEDTTAPTIAINGDNPMTVECHTSFTDPGATADDACAPDFGASASGTVDANTVGTYTITYNAIDPSGHAAAPVTRTVNVVDTTPPTVTAPSNVTVSTGAGGTSCGAVIDNAALGTASADDTCAGALSITISGVPSGNFFPVGQTTITYSATDAHSNSASATQVVTVIDNTPPAISCPSDIIVYLPMNSTATSMVVNYTAPVGTDNCAGATTTQTAGLASGASYPVGTTTNTFRVTDAAGNSTECSFTVNVLYNFAGFFSPVSNLPILNTVNAGRAIPVKFSLSGNKGLNIFAPDSPYTVGFDCGTAEENNIEETVTAGGSSLSYDAGSDQYHYVWKTEKSWAGTCRKLVVKLNDGTLHIANFKFR